jgi:serine/threonine protein kinase
MSPLNPEEVRLDPALAALTAGSRVGGGRFTLLRLLGQGGMGVVWLARDEQLREDVALKFLPTEIRHDAVALDDLRRETSRSRKLTHSNIIRIHDLYRVEQEAFISMEYVDGPNLSELRLEKADRVVKWGFLEPLVKQLCEALEYAHRENIIHRDLKPANMMLDGRGRLKLADFGIAAMVSDSVSRISMSRHGLSGTASYMSPQQLDGQLPQVTDDIYSLGSTLYELLTSRAPFFTGDIAHQVRTLAPQPIEKRLTQLRIHNLVPPTVGETIMACLAKEPEKRPQTARAVAEQLGLKTATPPSRKPSSAPEPPVSSSGPARPEPVPSPSPEVTPAPPAVAPAGKVPAAPATPAREDSGRAAPRRAKRGQKRRSRLVGLAAAVVIIAIGGAAWWWWQSRNAAVKTTHPTAAPEFVSLFNGNDFSGWDGDPQVWTVKDGTITATAGTSKERRPVALFWRGGTVEDFELHLSFRIQSGNSGIYYRAKQLLAYEVGGYQFEISGNQTGNLLETGTDRMRREPSRHGSVTIARVTDGKEKVTVVGPTPSSALEVRDAFHQSGWNDVVILVQGNRAIHKLNGHTMVDATDHYEKRPATGTIAFEVYGAIPTTVQFRDIRLKRLAPAGPAK